MLVRVGETYRNHPPNQADQNPYDAEILLFVQHTRHFAHTQRKASCSLNSTRGYSLRGRCVIFLLEM